LAEAGYQVNGLDPPWNRIRFCRQRVNQTHIAPYPVLASAAETSLQNQSISLTLVISMLFHLSLIELTNTLQEIYRVFLPGGKAILHFLDLDDWRHTLAKIISPGQAPSPGYQAVITCFCSWDENRGDQSSKAEAYQLKGKSSSSDTGEQRNWIAYGER
jgi:predicted SAM-dependent methyltransferase